MISREEEIARLKIKYEEALKGKSAEIALACGKAYFMALRDGVLLEEDKETLQNDLLRMVLN